jgi:hypothetical protein
MESVSVTKVTRRARRASDSPSRTGEFLMLLDGLGLAVFGIYGLCEARWRRV